MTSRARNIKMFEWKIRLEMRSFPNRLTLQLASHRTLVKLSNPVRKVPQGSQRTRSEDVAVGRVFHYVFSSKYHLSQTAHREELQPRSFFAPHCCELSSWQPPGVVAPWSTVRAGIQGLHPQTRQCIHDQHLIIHPSQVPPISEVEWWEVRDLTPLGFPGEHTSAAAVFPQPGQLPRSHRRVNQVVNGSSFDMILSRTSFCCRNGTCGGGGKWIGEGPASKSR